MDRMPTVEQLINQKMLDNPDTLDFFNLLCRDRKKANIAVDEVRRAIEKAGLTVSQAKGLMEYMKLIIDHVSYPSQTERQK